MHSISSTENIVGLATRPYSGRGHTLSIIIQSVMMSPVTSVKVYIQIILWSSVKLFSNHEVCPNCQKNIQGMDDGEIGLDKSF